MTEWGIDTLFNPGKRHMDEEKRRLQSTREEIGDSSGGRRIDLESGTVTISRPGKKPPATEAAATEADTDETDARDGAAAEADAAEDETAEADAAEAAESDEVTSDEAADSAADKVEGSGLPR